MDLLMSVLLLIIGLLISNVISHYIPSIPTALTQIGFWVFIALLFREKVPVTARGHCPPQMDSSKLSLSFVILLMNLERIRIKGG
jgi:hypothetical protein